MLADKLLTPARSGLDGSRTVPKERLPAANPPVKDRINAMNGAFCTAQGERHYRVNADLCPTFAEALETQAYDDKGQPDKTSGLDHPNDAAGYYIHRDFPLERPMTSLNIGVAI